MQGKYSSMIEKMDVILTLFCKGFNSKPRAISLQSLVFCSRSGVTWVQISIFMFKSILEHYNCCLHAVEMVYLMAKIFKKDPYSTETLYALMITIKLY